MAWAAIKGAMDKAQELGLERIDGIFGVAHAADAVSRLVMLGAILGPDGMQALEKALQDGMAKDAVQEAEEILKGEG
jgi:hypothetical protein